MGYLDNTSITVDAVLTKKGRQILSDGNRLDISSFTLSDTGVDYTLWNPDHPSGSAYYGEAIENMPMLEASVHAEYSLSNRLISLAQNTIAVPALELSGQSGTHVHTFDSNKSQAIVATIIGYASSLMTNSGTVGVQGIYLIIQDPNLVSTNATPVDQISGTGRQFLAEADIAGAMEYKMDGAGPDWTFHLSPIKQDTAGKETNVYVVHKESGAYAQLRVVNNITKPDTKNISPANIRS